ncbi:MAG: hypothetical protein AAF721_01620 [Myxococcota bacterium]
MASLFPVVRAALVGIGAFCAACGPSIVIDAEGASGGSSTGSSEGAGNSSRPDRVESTGEGSGGLSAGQECDSAYFWTGDCFPAETGSGYALPAACGCCPMELSCPLVLLECETPDGPQPCRHWRDGVAQDAESVRCALEALRDGRRGLLQIQGPHDDGGGARNVWVADRETIVVLERETRRGTSGRIDYVAEAKSPAYFDECLGKADRVSMTECLFDGVDGRGDTAVIECPGTD